MGTPYDFYLHRDSLHFLSFLAQVFEEDAAQVALTEARQNHDDQFTGVFRALADFDGGVNGGAGRDAHQETFFGGEAAGHVDRLVA